jgi:hypothetical protein
MGVKFNPFTGNLDLIDTTAAAGLDGQVQFNNSGLLDGSADFTWDDTGKVLDVGGDINLDDGGSFQTTLQLVTPTAERTITFPDATGTVGLVAGSTGQLVYNNAGAYSGLSGVTTDGTDVTLAGRFISSLNGAASAPPGTFTGTWFTGGTATTTKPQVLIEPTGTTSTAWSTSGTGLGVNAASGFSGRLLDLQTNGTSRAVVTGAGDVGIGTTAPGARLGVVGISGTYPTQLIGHSIGSTDGEFLRITRTDAPSIRYHSIHARHGGAEVAADNYVQFKIHNGSATVTAQNTVLHLDGLGRVGIGVTTPSSLLHLADAGNITVGATTGTKIGTATTQKLGFYNATPVVQPAAVTDITTTATAGTLPTPDGTVTIADADAPTVGELLEYCVELEAKLEAALGHLRTLGLIAT